MSDLEESGFIDHPHTSAGRIPTDKGYRFYVDSLMDIPELHHSEKGMINKNLDTNAIDTDELIRITSVLLSSITHQLACVSYPKLETGTPGKTADCFPIFNKNSCNCQHKIRTGKNHNTGTFIRYKAAILLIQCKAF